MDDGRWTLKGLVGVGTGHLDLNGRGLVGKRWGRRDSFGGGGSEL